MKPWWLFSESGDTPSTTAPAAFNFECSSRKSQASTVQPEVLSFG